eukprot:gene7135-14515_t
MSYIFKDTLDTPSNEKVFIRQALSQGLRLDGRKLTDCREIVIKLSRGEYSSYAEVIFGNTKVVCSVTGEIVPPYPDRPSEGIVQLNTEVSFATEKAGISKIDIARMLERSIKESDAIDTESLCIVSGEKVWNIRCDTKVLDYAGNVLDAASLATMAALRAFRKPEISLDRNTSSNISSISTSIDESMLLLNKSRSELKIHTSEEREPLPLALHHTPLCVSMCIFKNIPEMTEDFVTDNDAPLTTDVLILDPGKEEESATDGTIMFSVNAHR